MMLQRFGMICLMMYVQLLLFIHAKISFFIYLGFYVAFNTVQVISRWVVGRAEETSTYSWSRFCTVNCRPTVSNYQLSHLRPCWEPNPGLRGGRREVTTVPPWPLTHAKKLKNYLFAKVYPHCFWLCPGLCSADPCHVSGNRIVIFFAFLCYMPKVCL